MKSVEAVALLLAIVLAVSISVNILQYDSIRQLMDNISSYSESVEPLVLDSYTITEDAITLVLWNQGSHEVHMLPMCKVNGWEPNSFNQSTFTVPSDGTAAVTIDMPIECDNATYSIYMPYWIGSSDYHWNITHFNFNATIPHGAAAYEPTITAEQAIAIGRALLDPRNYTTGQVLDMGLTTHEPNTYWHGIFGIPDDTQPGFQHCWWIDFEQANRPGHFFEVWVNSETGEVIGGTQCL